MPRVAERRVAVAEVDGALAGTHAMGERAGGRHDDVVLAHVEAADRPRIERQQMPEGHLARAQPLQGRGPHVAPRETSLGPLGVVQRRVQRSVGPGSRHRREDPLGAAHDQQVVVDQADRRLHRDGRG